MADLDIKDRKILYQLDLDSRQSFRSIGRKVGLSKDTVIARVNRLEEAGVIDNYFTYIDTYKLGYTIFRCYFVFQYVSPEIEAEIINHFVNNSYAVNVNSLEG
ncbi:MAG: Lrp/AsnC family transcriptional regulator, partial [Thermoplasmatota archaeon]